MPNICFHCESPACADACPVDAISRNDIGTVIVDYAAYTGCAECVEACPYGMIELNNEGSAYKCDFCGGDPECVKVCQPMAIVYDALNEGTLKERLFQMSKKITEGEPENKRVAMAAIFKDLIRGIFK